MKTFRSRFARLALTVVTLALPLALSLAPARAALITSNALVPPPQKVVDFSQFTGNFTFIDGTSAPIQIGGLVGEDITFSANTFAVIGDGNFGLGANGSFDSGRVGFTGLNAGTGSLIYSFNTTPVSSVAGFINYSPNTGPNTVISAFNGATLLESYDISTLAPISTPGATNDGAFRGITRATADITSFTVSNQFVVLDNLTFSRAEVVAAPEPETWAMMGIGLLILGIATRRKKTTAYSRA